MLCSPPPATTLASSCAGSEGFCAPCCRRSSQRSRIHNRPKTGRTLLLHERLDTSLFWPLRDHRDNSLRTKGTRVHRRSSEYLLGIYTYQISDWSALPGHALSSNSEARTV